MTPARNVGHRVTVNAERLHVWAKTNPGTVAWLTVVNAIVTGAVVVVVCR